MSISLRRITAITRKNLQALLHDKRTLGLLIMMPVLMMFLFGYAFGQHVRHVPIKIVNFDEGGEGIPYLGINDTRFSEIFINFLREDDRVDIKLLNLETFNLSEEISQIYGGNDYYALVEIPINFTEDMLNFSNHIQISTYLDGSDPQTISSVIGAITEAIGTVINEISGEESHLKLDLIYIAGDPKLRPIDSLGPGILSFALFLFMILTVTGGFTKERLTGTLYRVKTTSTSKSEMMIGYLLGNSLIALVQSALLLAISVLFFQIHIVGSIILLFFILFIYAMSCVGLGIFASTFAKNELQAFQFIPLLLIPSMFFSGFIFPINSFPIVFQYVSYIIPMTYSIRISRAIMINGFSIDMFFIDFLIMILLTLVFLVLAIAVFKMKR
ncbi:MAG: ABC transporter permease [Candidatus Thorarchaeota archaeon]